jgi:CheY-like chemotaxis protein
MTSLLLDTDLPPEQRDYVETIRQSGDALLTIINDILDFSKIESGQMELEVQQFNLVPCIEEALDLFAAKAVEKGIELAYRIGSGVPDSIKGDMSRVRQILVNLLSNAVKVTQHGEIIVEVKQDGLTVDAKDGVDGNAALAVILHFTVRDTGIGIPADRMNRLFQSFSQVDASITGRYGGTGLGLAISKRLAALMGGNMWVESIEGRGSTFHFTLTACAGGVLPMHPKGADLTGRHVLIVDDNHTNCVILREQTRRWGMVPIACESGPAALALIDAGTTFDLAILDMHMPEMDGLRLAAEIRSRKSAAQFPLVMLTSLGDHFLRDEAAKYGFAAFVTKPVKQWLLYEILAQTLAEPSSTPVTAVSPAIFDRTFAARNPWHILLAEDNIVNQKVARQILGKLGYSADVAADGQEAVEALKRQSYDLIFMDVQMPVMNGLEATRAIRDTHPPQRQPVIIAMTAAATNEDRQACMVAGMDGYITKPIRLEQLMDALAARPANCRMSPLGFAATRNG